MADISVDVDEFGAALEQLLKNLDNGVRAESAPAIEHALETGEEAWKRNAKAVLSKSYSRGGWGRRKGQELYKSGKRKGQVKNTLWYGRTIKTGKYARSITHQMLDTGDNPSGEIGSRSMPGLAHLLEKGHAMVDGGFVGGREHIAPAAEEAFKAFQEEMEDAVERAIDEL